MEYIDTSLFVICEEFVEQYKSFVLQYSMRRMIVVMKEPSLLCDIIIMICSLSYGIFVSEKKSHRVTNVHGKMNSRNLVSMLETMWLGLILIRLLLSFRTLACYVEIPEQQMNTWVNISTTNHNRGMLQPLEYLARTQ